MPGMEQLDLDTIMALLQREQGQGQGQMQAPQPQQPQLDLGTIMQMLQREQQQGQAQMQGPMSAPTTSAPSMGGGRPTDSYISPDLGAIFGNSPGSQITRTMPVDQAMAVDAANMQRHRAMNVPVSGAGQAQNMEQVLAIVKMLQGVNPKLASAITSKVLNIDPESDEQKRIGARQKDLAQFTHGLNQPSKDQKMQADAAYKQQLLEMRQQAIDGQKERRFKTLMDAYNNTIDPQMKAVLAQMIQQFQQQEGVNPSAPLEGNKMPKATVRRIN